MDFHENHQQGDGGQELSQDEKAEQRASDEGMAQKVEEAKNDPTVLATPTEIQQGGVSGGDPGNTRGGGTGPVTPDEAA